MAARLPVVFVSFYYYQELVWRLDNAFRLACFKWKFKHTTGLVFSCLSTKLDVKPHWLSININSVLTVVWFVMTIIKDLVRYTKHVNARTVVTLVLGQIRVQSIVNYDHFLLPMPKYSGRVLSTTWQWQVYQVSTILLSSCLCSFSATVFLVDITLAASRHNVCSQSSIRFSQIYLLPTSLQTFTAPKSDTQVLEVKADTSTSLATLNNAARVRDFCWLRANLIPSQFMIEPLLPYFIAWHFCQSYCPPRTVLT